MGAGFNKVKILKTSHSRLDKLMPDNDKIFTEEDASSVFIQRQVMVFAIYFLMKAKFWLLIRQLGRLSCIG